MKLFYDYVLGHPKWRMIEESGVIKIPTARYTHPDQFHTPVVPILTEMGLSHDLQKWLRQRGFLTHAIRYPTVPKTGERIRFMMHISHTPQVILSFVNSMMEWGESHVTGQNLGRL